MDAEVAVKYESAQYTGIIYLRNKENIYCWHKKHCGVAMLSCLL